ncbi:MAG: hypothetical protein F4Z58_00765 [Acidimicrobiaceae bacterium]|nr:hypothetical protein [Acidimicrobiaceae bacterium]MXW74558.1 hypothetical protein [Acidimicrobiaceae bacterium]MYC43921.1 hypothetical protein [Acidimicrobiaceae bacterium]MYD07056.1 hypothetical protein [Acidimicrobiaceae bacterium]MYH88145.1 hypothetical protein [Acidimicrobiaceae bacterium]
MCAIVDASIVGNLLGSDANPAATGFRKAVDNGTVPLVVGGTRLDCELKNTGARQWVRELTNAGRLTRVDDSEVDNLAEQLDGFCKSNDSHIIALAQISGARLLYTNDQALTGDFRNSDLVNNPRGKVYSTRVTKEFNASRRKLLNNRELCRTLER